ncbi:MAG: PrsW family intramembrane metalloprotease [Clostridiales bacterium]|nr:PrsW family intramembrane metalloprotease [Candidatus Scatonaster coprocaballi]
MIYAENILLCIAIPFLVSVLFLRGEVRRYVSAFLLGMGMCLVAAYISGFLSLVAHLEQNDASIFLSPMVEELIKLLPLLFFLVLLEPEEHDFIMLAVAIGAGFSTFENCCYILSFGAESITYIMIRGLAVGVMHIVSLLALSIWLIFVKRFHVFSFPAIIGGLSIAMSFHALYNLLVSEPGVTRAIGYLLPLLTAICLYPLYRRLQISQK